MDTSWANAVHAWTKQFIGVDLGAVGLGVLIFLAFILTRTLVAKLLFGALTRIAERKASKTGAMFIEAAEGPFRFLYLVVGFLIAMHVAGVDAIEAWSVQFGRSLILFTIFWTVYNVVEALSHLLSHLISQPRTSTSARETLRAFFVPLVRAVVVALGVAAILQEWGFNVAAVLGGLGLAGMAVALAGQNIIANLFSAIMIFFTRIFEKGNWIKTPSLEGTVEQVGLMTTRVRQFDNAMVIIENSQLTSGPIVNYTRMRHRRIYWNIGLNYRTTADQLQAIVKGIHDYIYGNDAFETDPKKVSTFVVVDTFGDSSINIMLYCFTKTTDWGEWLSAKQALALEIKEIVERNGAGFAFPSTSLYVEQWPFGQPEPFSPATPDRPMAPEKPSTRS